MVAAKGEARNSKGTKKPRLPSIPEDQDDKKIWDGYGDDRDLSSLIPGIGRDNSISCVLRCSRSDYGVVAALNRSFRDLVRSGEIYRLRQKEGITEDWIYLSCGINEWVAYNPIRHQWINLPNLISEDVFAFSDKEAMAIGTDLLVFGKDMTSHIVHKYSHLTNSWSRGTPLGMPRCLFGHASMGHIGIVAGGCRSVTQVYSYVEMYDLETDTWTRLPDMNKARRLSSAVFLDGKFYVVGGIDADRNFLRCAEVYDLKTKHWQVIPDMLPERMMNDLGISGAPSLLAVVNNELYCANHTKMELRKYDMARNRWSVVGHLPGAEGSPGWGVAFKGCGSCAVFVTRPRVFAQTVALYRWDPREETPRWVCLGEGPRSAFVFNCAVMRC
ncbi:hypothetical protein MLD38_031945 [Melastoma candidum]|nr:hypothetical protein MLD38_031945 [Melastoma candidum]